MSRPVVAVVGRPNVGKSTLFNVLAGERISIVQDTPGVTRDRIYADVSWLNMSFTLIDTGGIEPDSSDMMLSRMREQAQIAIDTADVIIFLTDVRQGLVDADSKVADMLRRAHMRTVFAQYAAGLPAPRQTGLLSGPYAFPCTGPARTNRKRYPVQTFLPLPVWNKHNPYPYAP